MKFPGLQELSSFVQFQHLEIGVARVSALGNRKHCLNSSHPPRQMPRLTRGWVRVGREYAPESVNCAAAFMAPQIHFLMMWSGGTSQDDCRVLSCPQYERMNTDTAFKMSAAGGVGLSRFCHLKLQLHTQRYGIPPRRSLTSGAFFLPCTQGPCTNVSS